MLNSHGSCQGCGEFGPMHFLLRYVTSTRSPLPYDFNRVRFQVIIGAVAIRSLNATLEPSPLEKLSHACDLFQSASESSSRALRALVSSLILRFPEGRLTIHFSQPILLRMREKALQSRQPNLEDGRLDSYSPVEPFDEIAIFAGRTGLVKPKHSFDVVSPVEPPSGIRLPSIPNLLHPPLAGIVPPPVSHSSYRSDPNPQSAYIANDTTTTSADLPLNWEGLYREIPSPSYHYGTEGTYPDTAGPTNAPTEGVMLEDRWSSFMHHYAMIGDVQSRTHY